MEMPVRHVHCIKGNGALAEVATMFVSATVSEAEVERLLSAQKRVQRQYMTNISPEGLTAGHRLVGTHAISEVRPT